MDEEAGGEGVGRDGMRSKVSVLIATIALMIIEPVFSRY